MKQDLKWWQKSIAYQVYPKSFYDSNGDGIGDLRGIIQKLDYIQELGTDLLYLNPICKSPMKDNGYDVSDYYEIDPMFGTTEDMKELIHEADKRGIHVIMDMVLNHCSDQHEWFQQVLKDPEGEYADYFFLRKGEGENPPNNWRSIFGGSAWEKIPGSEYYYLHLFTKEQVDLNWDNPRLREKMYRMMNYWLDLGVSGFRLDAVTYMKKKEGLPSFPADGPDGLVSVKHGTLNQPGLEAFLKEMKEKTYGKGDYFVIGEMEDADVHSMQNFISLKNGYFSCIFEVSHLSLGRKAPNYFWFEEEEWDPDELRDQLLNSQTVLCPDMWIATFLECHDIPRAADRLLREEGKNFYGFSMLGMMYLYLWGTPFIYQGQELGMRNFAFPELKDYDDCSTHNQYELAREYGFTEAEALKIAQKGSRDNARYPMPWNSGKNGGFTEGTPWLPVNPDHKKINVEKEREDKNSLLSFYKKMIALKRSEEYSEVLATGKITPFQREQKGIFAYTRSNDSQSLRVICNNQNESCQIELPKAFRVLLNNHSCLEKKEKTIELLPYQAVLLEDL